MTLSHWSVSWVMYKMYGITDMGLVRKNNEDGFLLHDVLITEGDYSLEKDAPIVAVVADGMGGANAGEIASFLTLESFARLEDPIGHENDLKTLIEINIQQKLFSHMDKHPEAKGMGSTIAGMVCTLEKAFIFHIGDSRVYRFRDGFLKPLTKDHSLVESLYRSGQISLEEKQHFPQKNIILRSLGEEGVEVEINPLPSLPEVGDLFLICSDGITDDLTDDEIEDILCRQGSIEVQAKRLIGLAKERGGHDNMTVVLVACN